LDTFSSNSTSSYIELSTSYIQMPKQGLHSFNPVGLSRHSKFLCLLWFKRSFLYVLYGLKAEHLKNPSKPGRQIGAHFSCSFTFLHSLHLPLKTWP